jgi:hypothetical protein
MMSSGAILDRSTQISVAVPTTNAIDTALPMDFLPAPESSDSQRESQTRSRMNTSDPLTLGIPLWSGTAAGISVPAEEIHSSQTRSNSFADCISRHRAYLGETSVNHDSLDESARSSSGMAGQYHRLEVCGKGKDPVDQVSLLNVCS